MKRLAPVVIVLMLAALVSAMPSAYARSTTSAKANSYRTYTACSAKPDAVPARRCPKKGKKGAFFKSVDAHVTYKVCVKFPNGTKLCAGHQDAPRGKLQINPITSRKVGQHTVTWFVAGHKVSTRRFTIHG
jgi:hypothetical protein